MLGRVRRLAPAVLLLLGCKEEPAAAEADADVPADAAVDAPVCPDEDRDEWRDSACGGRDCDDSDQSIREIQDCLARCEANPSATTPETLGVGVCTDGVHQCVDGRWSPCEGEVVPSAQTRQTPASWRSRRCSWSTTSAVGDAPPPSGRRCPAPAAR